MDNLPVHGFAAAALQKYKGKEVEINTGESYTTLLFDDHTQGQKSVIRGTLVDAAGDAIVLEVNIRGKKHEVLINCWLIHTMMEFGSGSSRDFYIDEYKELESKRKFNR